MNEYANYVEYSVKKKVEGKLLRNRVLLIIGYILLAMIILVLVMKSGFVPLGAFIPFAVVLAVFLTWKYVNIEYDYSIATGLMTVATVYGSRSRRDMVEVKVKEMSIVAPYDEDRKKELEKTKFEHVYTAVSTMSSPDIYCAVFEHEEKGKKGRALLLFEATNKVIKTMRFYNAASVVMPKNPLRY